MSLMQRIDDITRLLDINYEDYLNAKNEFIQNPSQASVKYFDYDMNSNNFIDFGLTIYPNILIVYFML